MMGYMHSNKSLYRKEPDMNASTSLSYLVLLPPVPESPDFATVHKKLHAPLSLVLRLIQEKVENVSGPRVLDIALPCPLLYVSTIKLRSQLYPVMQQVVANVYKLIYLIAGQQKIETANIGQNYTDIRILLISYPGNGQLEDKKVCRTPFGPVIDLHTLARSRRPWKLVFTVGNEEGEQFFKQFAALDSARPSDGYCRLQIGDNQLNKSVEEKPAINSHVYCCRSVAVGGTFDHLHIGHKLLLTMTAFILDWMAKDGSRLDQGTLTIGITAAGQLAKKKYVEYLEPWERRANCAHEFIRGILFFPSDQTTTETLEEIHEPGPNGHALIARFHSKLGTLEIRYVEIWDPFGPTITDGAVDTLVVSAETRQGGVMVNDTRKQKNMEALIVFEVQVLSWSTTDPGQDSFQAKLSSTETRRILAQGYKP